VVEPTGQEVCRVERSTPFALLGKIVAAWSHARRLEHLHNSTRSRRSPTQLERRRAKKYSTGWYCTGTLIACSTGYCRDTPRKPVKSKQFRDRRLSCARRSLLLSSTRRHALARGEHSCRVPTACNRGVTLVRSWHPGSWITHGSNVIVAR